MSPPMTAAPADSGPALEMATRTTNDIFLMSMLNNMDRYFSLLISNDTASNITLREDYIRNLIQLIGDTDLRIKISDQFDNDMHALSKDVSRTEDEKEGEKRQLLAAGMGSVSGYMHQYLIKSEINIVAPLGQDIGEEDVREFLDE